MRADEGTGAGAPVLSNVGVLRLSCSSAGLRHRHRQLYSSNSTSLMLANASRRVFRNRAADNDAAYALAGLGQVLADPVHVAQQLPHDAVIALGHLEPAHYER